MKQVVAIIPARGGSKGIPRKNLQKVDGIPLVGLAIQQAQQARNIHRVFVSTEDAEIALVAKGFGAETLGRSEEFIHDNTFMEVDRLLQWSVRLMEQNGVEIDVLTMLYPTAPLRTIQSIEQTVAKVVEGGYDSALTLYDDSKYLWKVHADGSALPVNYDPKKRGPRQLEGWNQWAENKAVYAMTKALIMETGCRLGGRIGFVPMNAWESIDVDAPEDLEMVRAILLARKSMRVTP